VVTCGDSDISHALIILQLPANLGISFLFSFANYDNLLMYARFLMCSGKSVASAQGGPHLQGNRAVLTSETNFVNFTSILFIPCIVDNHFATLNQQNAQYCCLDIYNTLNIQRDINIQCGINIQCDIINI